MKRSTAVAAVLLGLQATASSTLKEINAVSHHDCYSAFIWPYDDVTRRRKWWCLANSMKAQRVGTENAYKKALERAADFDAMIPGISELGRNWKKVVHQIDVDCIRLGTGTPASESGPPESDLDTGTRPEPELGAVPETENHLRNLLKAVAATKMTNKDADGKLEFTESYREYTQGMQFMANMFGSEFIGLEEEPGELTFYAMLYLIDVVGIDYFTPKITGVHRDIFDVLNLVSPLVDTEDNPNRLVRSPGEVIALKKAFEGWLTSFFTLKIFNPVDLDGKELLTKARNNGISYPEFAKSAKTQTKELSRIWDIIAEHGRPGWLALLGYIAAYACNASKHEAATSSPMKLSRFLSGVKKIIAPTGDTYMKNPNPMDFGTETDSCLRTYFESLLANAQPASKFDKLLNDLHTQLKQARTPTYSARLRHLLLGA